MFSDEYDNIYTDSLREAEMDELEDRLHGALRNVAAPGILSAAQGNRKRSTALWLFHNRSKYSFEDPFLIKYI